MKNSRLFPFLILTIVSFLWGIASPVIKYTLSFIAPYSFLFWRFLITCLIFLPFFIFFVRKHPLHLNELPMLVFLGFLGTPLTLILLFLGYQTTTSIDGVLISATAPIFITVGGVIFLKEKVTKRERIGLAIAILGSLVAIIQPLLETGLLKDGFKGNLLIFGSVISWTIFTLLSKDQFKKYHPFVITILPFFIFERLALIDWQKSVFLPASPFFQIPSGSFPGILYMSVFSSFIAYTLFEYGLSLIEASEATLFAYLQPIFAAPFALVWLKEQITPTFALGAVLIFLGVVVAETRKEVILKRKL